MVDSSLILWLAALGLGIAVWRRLGYAAFRAALKAAAVQLIVIIPKMSLALLTAGFIGKMVPAETIGHMIGFDSGISGILIASVFGGIMPSGPMIAFPLVVVLRISGAGVPQVAAFLAAWSVFALHRVLIYEVAMMGYRFATIRLVSSLTLPIVSGGIAMALCLLTGMR
jgi:uncharacterized membrane protein YraQ (UPF0718 family)